MNDFVLRENLGTGFAYDEVADKINVDTSNSATLPIDPADVTGLAEKLASHSYRVWPVTYVWNIHKGDDVAAIIAPMLTYANPQPPSSPPDNPFIGRRAFVYHDDEDPRTWELWETDGFTVWLADEQPGWGDLVIGVRHAASGPINGGTVPGDGDKRDYHGIILVPIYNIAWGFQTFALGVDVQPERVSNSGGLQPFHSSNGEDWIRAVSGTQDVQLTPAPPTWGVGSLQRVSVWNDTAGPVTVTDKRTNTVIGVIPAGATWFFASKNGFQFQRIG